MRSSYEPYPSQSGHPRRIVRPANHIGECPDWAPSTPQSGIDQSVAWAEPLEVSQTTTSAITTVRLKVVGYEKRSSDPSDSAIGRRKVGATEIGIVPSPEVPEQTDSRIVCWANQVWYQNGGGTFPGLVGKIVQATMAN